MKCICNFDAVLASSQFLFAKPIVSMFLYVLSSDGHGHIDVKSEDGIAGH